MERKQPDLVLIVARSFATKLATPTLIIDARGNLVYFNDATAEVLGRSYSEVGVLQAPSWQELFQPRTLEEEPLTASARSPSPPSRSSRTPTRSSASCRSFGSFRRRHDRPSLGCARLAFGAWTRDRRLRRQHLLRRDRPHRRHDADSRRGLRDPRARATACRARPPRASHLPDSPPPRPCGRARLLRTIVARRLEAPLLGASVHDGDAPGARLAISVAAALPDWPLGGSRGGLFETYRASRGASAAR